MSNRLKAFASLGRRQHPSQGLDRGDGVRANRRFTTQHHRVHPGRHAMGGVRNLGPGRHGMLVHGFEHLGGRDHRFGPAEQTARSGAGLELQEDCSAPRSPRAIIRASAADAISSNWSIARTVSIFAISLVLWRHFRTNLLHVPGRAHERNGNPVGLDLSGEPATANRRRW